MSKDEPNPLSEETAAPKAPDGTSSQENPSGPSPSAPVGAEEFKVRISALEQQLKDEHERVLRFAADMDNLRKRTRRDVEDAVGRGQTEVLREILSVIDAVDLALEAGDPSGPAKPVIEGIELVRRQFLAAAEKFACRPIAVVGKAFDPNFQEAISQVFSDDFEVGQIVKEVRRGYTARDRLLRPAMVVVSLGKYSTDDRGSEAQDEVEGTPTRPFEALSMPEEDPGDREVDENGVKE